MSVVTEHPYCAEMSALCRSFHALQGAPGTEPWDQYEFARWLHGPAPSNAMRQAGLFVLSVWAWGNHDDWWNNNTEVPGLEGDIGVFDLVKAWKLWDAEHCQAFLDWCDNPFSP